MVKASNSFLIYKYARGNKNPRKSTENTSRLFDHARLVSFFNAVKKVSKHQHKPKGASFWIKEGDADFKCKLRSIKCCALKKDGKPCTRNVIQGIFCCFQHVSNIFNIRIDKSGIVFQGHTMNGLFACDMSKGSNAIVFRKGEEICPYFGEVLTKAQLDERYPGDVTAAYTLQISPDKFIDAACFMSFGAKSNKPPTGKSSTANAALHLPPKLHYNYGRLLAKKNIRNGTEIFLSYGRQYRFSNSGIKSGGKIKKKKKKCSS